MELAVLLAECGDISLGPVLEGSGNDLDAQTGLHDG